MRYLIIPILIFCLFITPQMALSAACEFASTTLASDANLIAYYKMEDVSDSKGSYTLTNQNTVAFNAGKFSNAADGGNPNTNKALYRNDDYGINGAASYSIMCWYNPTSAPTTGTQDKFFAKLYANSSGYLESCGYYNNVGTLQIFCPVIRNSPYNITYNTTLSLGTWYHFALVRNGGASTVAYMNGESIGTSSQTGTWDGSAYTSRVAFLSEWDLTNHFAAGLADDCQIFNRALTGAEVRGIYQGTYCGAPPAAEPSKGEDVFIFRE